MMREKTGTKNSNMEKNSAEDILKFEFISLSRFHSRMPVRVASLADPNRYKIQQNVVHESASMGIDRGTVKEQWDFKLLSLNLIRMSLIACFFNWSNPSNIKHKEL